MPFIRPRFFQRQLRGPVLALLASLATMLLLSSQSLAASLAVPASPKGPVSSTPRQLRALGITGTGWHLSFNATFRGPTPSPNLWSLGWFAYGSAISQPVNSTEAACYNSANVHKVSGGIGLTLSATPSTCEGQTRPYTGALMSTNPDDGRSGGGFQFTYGVLQARIYLPGIRNNKRVGNWPVLMTVGQPASDSEDDILEGLDGSVCAHYHSSSTVGYAGAGLCDHTLGGGWHTFTANWQPGSVTWYYDGKKFDTVTQGIAADPMYIVLAVTATDQWGAQINRPATMKVAYVKVWQQAPPQA